MKMKKSMLLCLLLSVCGAMCILISCIGIVLDAIDMTRICNQGAMYNGYSGRMTGAISRV
jgi:hypothetical protein